MRKTTTRTRHHAGIWVFLGVILLVAVTIAVSQQRTPPTPPAKAVRAIPTITQIPECVHEAVTAPCYVRWVSGHSVIYMSDCGWLKPTTLDVECAELQPAEPQPDPGAS